MGPSSHRIERALRQVLVAHPQPTVRALSVGQRRGAACPCATNGGSTHLDGGAVEVAAAGVVERVARVALVLKRHEAEALGAAGLLVEDELGQGREAGGGGGWEGGVGGERTGDGGR